MRDENLLPWRERRYRELKTQWCWLCIGICLIALIITGVGRECYVTQLARAEQLYQQRRQQDQRLSAELAQMSQLHHQLNQLELELDRLNHWADQRLRLPQALQEIKILLPAGVYLSQLNCHHTRLTIDGQATDATKLNQFLQNVSSAKTFQHVVLQSLKLNEQAGSHQFTLQANLVS